MNNKNHISIIFIDEQRGKPLNILLPRHLYYLLIGLGCLLLVLLTGGIISYSSLFSKAMQAKRLATKVNELEMQTEKLVEIQAELDQMADIRTHIENMIGYKNIAEYEKSLRENESELVALPFVHKNETGEKFELKNELIEWANSQLTQYEYIPVGLPTKGWITAQFAQTLGFLKPHQGVDIATAEGTVVRVTASGLVDKTGYDTKLGKFIIVNHLNNYKTLYAHLQKIEVTEAQPVSKGERLGLAGATGSTEGPHVHYEVRYRNKPVDPLHTSKGLQDNITS